MRRKALPKLLGGQSTQGTYKVKVQGVCSPKDLEIARTRLGAVLNGAVSVEGHRLVVDFEGSLPYEAVSDLDSVLDSLGENASSPGLLFEEAGDRRRFLVIRVGVIDAQPIDHKDLNEIV